MNDYDRGLAVRREVLGDSYVDQAGARTTDLTREFQTLVTEFAWGAIWTRPGLDRRSRSMITLTALIARGRDEELALHLRAALRNGLSWDEIKEVRRLLRCAGRQRGIPYRPRGLRRVVNRVVQTGSAGSITKRSSLEQNARENERQASKAIPRSPR